MTSISFYRNQGLETVFDYEITFPDVYGQWPCCKLMFQPFVENSILHGFEGRESGGFIRIQGEMEEERLKIVIEDNGCGMDPDTEKVIQKILHDEEEGVLESGRRTGIGIKNVVTRMRMFYGSRMGVEMETAQGKGTRFVFRIPIPECQVPDSDTDEEIDGEMGD